MAGQPKKGAILVARSKTTIALPPCTLGFASLTTPDTFDEDKPQFRLNAHFTPVGLEELADIIAKKCIAGNLPALKKEAAALDVTLGKSQTATEWLESKLKQPKDEARIQLPFMAIATKATGKTKTGEPYTKTIKAWDAHNNALNLEELRLGMGSIVQAIVYPNLVYRKVDGYARPSFQLVGVRVLKLVQWGGSGPQPGEVSDEEMQRVLGQDFAADDLSAFAGTAAVKSPKMSNPPDTDLDAADDVF